MGIRNEDDNNLDILYSRTMKALVANNLETLVLSSENRIIKKTLIDSMIGRFPNLKKFTLMSSQHLLAEDSFKTIVEKYPQIVEFKYHCWVEKTYIYCDIITKKVTSNIADFMNSSENLKYALINYNANGKIACRCKGWPHECLRRFRLHLQNYSEKAVPALKFSEFVLRFLLFIV